MTLWKRKDSNVPTSVLHEVYRRDGYRAEIAIGAITAFSTAADVVTGGAMTNGMVIFLRALYMYFNNN